MEISQKDAKKAIELLTKYVDGVDSAVLIANGSNKSYRDVFLKTNAKQVYESQKISSVYLQAKELIKTI